MIKVSVIIPVFKVPEKFIRECFNSLSAQTLQDCEFILVSDGAPEKECAICEEYAAKDSRFKFFKRNHEGVSSTRNFGIKQASGDYITFIDSDDWIEPTCCEELLNFAIKHNSDVVLFDYVPEGVQFKKRAFADKIIDELSPKDIDEIQQQCILFSDDRFVAAVSTCCKFSKKNLFSEYKISFAKGIVCCEDRPVSYKIFEHSKKTSYLNKSFYHYQLVQTSATHVNDGSSLLSWFPYLIEIRKISSKHRELIGNYALTILLGCFMEDYFSSNSKDSMLDKVNVFRILVNSNDVQWIIHDASIDKEDTFPLSTKLESFFIRHKSIIPIWPHIIKWKIIGHK